MEPYDAEFRGEVLAACDANEGTRTIAVRFKVSDSRVRQIKQHRRETGQIERFHFRCGVLGAMPTLVVGMFSRENRYIGSSPPGTDWSVRVTCCS